MPPSFRLLRPESGTFTNLCWYADGTPQDLEVLNGRVVHRRPSTNFAQPGQWLAPAFVDAHCHILPTGLDMLKLSLIDAHRHEDVLERVAAFERALEPGKWLMAVHYDQTKYAGGRHLTRGDLDRISSTRPMLLRHSNGHASIANSAALQAAGVTASTPDPKGGTYVRDASGELNGVLLEKAHEIVTAAAPSPTTEEMVEAILRATESMSEMGIVEATDMMTGRYDLKRELVAYRLAADRGCRVRTRLCIQWAERFGPRGQDVKEELAALDGDRVGVYGIKIFADGAIGSATAAIYGSYTSDPSSSGTLMYAPERLMAMVTTAHDAGYRVAVHSIGDRSTDLVFDAFEATGEGSRHRIEHAMMLSDAQIERMATIGCHCTMQPEFLARFGHSYRHHLGPERASTLKRMRSVKDAQIPLSLSSDRPIVSGDPWLGVSAACSRPDGFDPAEALTWEEAMEAYTTMGAVANASERHELQPGDRAEFLVFERS